MPIVNSPEILTAKENALRLVISDSVALVTDVTYPTLSLMRNKVFQRQKKVSWNADIGGTDVVIKDVVEDAANATQGELVPADLPIGQTAITHTFDIDLTEAEQAAATGIDEVKNLFSAHTNRGITKIMRTINRLIYTGDGTKASSRVIGLEKVIDNTYAYAGISPTTYTAWKSLVLANGGTKRDLDVNMMLDLETEMLIQESTYDMILCHPYVANKYAKLFTENRQIQVSGSAPNRVDLGVSDLYFNNRPVVRDPACTKNTIYFVDSYQLFLHSYRVKGDATLEGIAVKSGMLATQNVYSEKWEIGVIPQLQVFNRRAVSAIKDIKDGTEV